MNFKYFFVKSNIINTSYFLSNLLISSNLSKEGDNPPCNEKIYNIKDNI